MRQIKEVKERYDSMDWMITQSMCEYILTSAVNNEEIKLKMMRGV